MAGDEDRAAEINQLRALVLRQGTDIKILREVSHDAETHAVFRVWGVALLAGLFATTMGTWLVVPVFRTSGDYSTFDSVTNYGFWDVFGSPQETVGGQTGITIALLLVLIGIGMAALSVPTSGRLFLASAGSVVLFASEIWLRVGFSGQVATMVEGGSDGNGGLAVKPAYAYGGPAMTLAFLFTSAIAVGAFSQAQVLRSAERSRASRS